MASGKQQSILIPGGLKDGRRVVIQEGSDFWEVSIRRLNAIEKDPPKEYLFTLESLSEGMISEFFAQVGNRIAVGDQILLFAENGMKTVLCSPVSGIIDTIHVNAGDLVTKKKALVTIRLHSESED